MNGLRLVNLKEVPWEDTKQAHRDISNLIILTKDSNVGLDLK